jgi:hypothetical protein
MNTDSHESPQSNATVFTGYFFETIARINNLRDDSSAALDLKDLAVRQSVESSNNLKCSLLRKILFMGVIDTLSQATFSSMKRQNHQRVVNFIDTCSGWADKDRVSAPQLLLALKRAHQTTTDLYRFAESHLASWRDGAILGPDSDLTLTDALKHAADPKEKILVQKRTYKELFYSYRNKLIHEFREPGKGIDFAMHGVPGGWNTPYYHGMVGIKSWQLVFPEAFVSKLCHDFVAGSRQYLIANKIDPYANFDFGSHWG